MDSTRSPNERLDGIQVLRGIAALGVALFHFSMIEKVYGPDRVMSEFFTYGQAGVDLFFVISGYIMVHATRDMHQGKDSAGTFMWRRVLRIYPPYWIVTFTLLSVWLISGGAALNNLIGANPNFLASFTLWPDKRPPILNVGWTLSHEVYFYCCFALVLLAPKSARPPLLLGWGAIMATALILNARGSPLAALVSHPLNFEFLLGAGAAWLRPHFGTRANWIALMLALIFTAAALTHWGLTPNRDALRDHVLRAFFFAPIGASLVFVCAGASILWPLALKRLGDLSYALYLVHVPAFAVTGSLWRKVATPGYADNILALLIMIGAAIVCAHLFYKYVERPLGRLKFAPLRPKLAQLNKSL